MGGLCVMLGLEVYVGMESPGLEMSEGHWFIEFYEYQLWCQSLYTYSHIKPSEYSHYGEVVPTLQLCRYSLER